MSAWIGVVYVAWCWPFLWLFRLFRQFPLLPFSCCCWLRHSELSCRCVLCKRHHLLEYFSSSFIKPFTAVAISGEMVRFAANIALFLFLLKVVTMADSRHFCFLEIENCSMADSRHFCFLEGRVFSMWIAYILASCTWSYPASNCHRLRHYVWSEHNRLFVLPKRYLADSHHW